METELTQAFYAEYYDDGTEFRTPADDFAAAIATLNEMISQYKDMIGLEFQQIWPNEWVADMGPGSIFGTMTIRADEEGLALFQQKYNNGEFQFSEA